MKYVEEPNELDHKVVELENQILKLEKDSHPPIFSKKERNDILKRLKRLEAIDYDMQLRSKDE